MSKTDPSSSNAAGTDWPGRADGDAGRQGTTLADQPEAPTRPTRDVDDSWALSAAMQVPNVPGLSEPDEQPAPPLIPAAAPTGHGSGREAAASVVARAAALRAMGAKTMQGLGPAPINRAQKLSEAVAAAARQVAAESAAASAAVADLEEEPTHFTNAPASSAAAANAAVAELAAEAPTHHAPAAANQAPLYLDDPPDMLRLSTGTSELSVPEIDPGVSAVLSPRDGADEGALLHDDGSYSSDSAPYPAEPSEPFAHEDGYAAAGPGQEPDDSEAAPEDEDDGHDDTRDDVGYQSSADVGYGDAAPEAMPPAAQLVAPTTAALRAYGGDGVPRATSSDWFEPSGGHAQQIADAVPYGHASPQQDFSFTEPSRRRNRPPGPNRWIAPLAVVVALAAVVFAGGYFYTRGSAAKRGPEVAASGAAAAADPGAAAGASGASGSAAQPAAAAAAGGNADNADNADNAAAPSSTVAAGLVDVRFDSNPPGAMVMLVDRGRGVTSPVGTTPVRTALEPKGTYDAIFTLEGHPTKVISLAGPKSARVVADLSGAGGEQVATAPISAVAPAVPAGADDAAKADEDRGAQVAVEDKGAQAARPDKRDVKTSSRKDKRKPGRPAAAGGDSGDDGDEPEEKGGAADGAMGSLSISAKPACEIAINGKSIGRSTPVKDFPLSVGIHKITFINKAIGVNETIAVRVTAGKETKVAQDYTGTP